VKCAGWVGRAEGTRTGICGDCIRFGRSGALGPKFSASFTRLGMSGLIGLVCLGASNWPNDPTFTAWFLAEALPLIES
jgi:hypothetical protein